VARCYPVFLDVSGRLCVVVGGGAVAERKLGGLLDAGAEVRVVSPAVTNEIRRLGDAGAIDLRLERYAGPHIDGALLVFAATDDRAVNARVAADAAVVGALANIADAPDDGAFILPSVVRNGDLCIAVSTGGASPMLAARIADELQLRFGADFGAYVELLGAMRDSIKQITESKAARRAALVALLDDEAALREHIAAGRLDAARELATRLAVEAIRAPAHAGSAPADGSH
jgi:precorrin-2 dehydrogenase / sirohydrochlorin ferrochelatase